MFSSSTHFSFAIYVFVLLSFAIVYCPSVVCKQGIFTNDICLSFLMVFFSLISPQTNKISKSLFFYLFNDLNKYQVCLKYISRNLIATYIYMKFSSKQIYDIIDKTFHITHFILLTHISYCINPNVLVALEHFIFVIPLLSAKFGTFFFSKSH